jgi:hypothetical protein
LTASSKVVLRNGLNRHSTAPSAIKRAHRLIACRGDENDWNRLPQTDQLLLEFRARHAWHPDVEDQAARLGDAIGLQERLGGCERLWVEAELAQQVRQRLAH